MTSEIKWYLTGVGRCGDPKGEPLTQRGKRDRPLGRRKGTFDLPRVQPGRHTRGRSGERRREGTLPDFGKGPTGIYTLFPTPYFPLYIYIPLLINKLSLSTDTIF